MTFKLRRQIKNKVVSVGVRMSGVTATEPEAVGGIVSSHRLPVRGKERMKAGSLRRMKEGRKKRGFLHLFEGNITRTLSPCLRNLQRNQLILYQPVMH